MSLFELLAQTAVPRFTVTPEGEIYIENSQATNPNEEIFNLEVDVPF